MENEPNKPLWKSYVWYEDKCYFVSTIERTYDSYEGSHRGQETIVWEYDWDTATRGNMLLQAGHVGDHQTICRCLIAEGEIPNVNNPRHERFFK